MIHQGYYDYYFIGYKEGYLLWSPEEEPSYGYHNYQPGSLENV